MHIFFSMQTLSVVPQIALLHAFSNNAKGGIDILLGIIFFFPLMRAKLQRLFFTLLIN